MRKNLILFLIITFLSFLLLETLVRLFYPLGLKDYWTENETQYGLMVNKKNYSYKNHRVKNLVASCQSSSGGFSMCVGIGVACTLSLIAQFGNSNITRKTNKLIIILCLFIFYY